MNRDDKAKVIEEIAAQMEQAEAVYVIDYRGLTVTQAAELRSSLREAGASLRVVKNTLTLRAADKAGADQLKPLVEDGPTALTFVAGDPALAAKTLDGFARQAQVLEFKGGLLAGDALTGDEVRQIARLPGRDLLNAQIAGVVASPLTGLVRGLGALVSGLAVALGQVAAQKEDDTPAAAAEPAAQETAAEEPAAEEPAAEAEEPAAEKTEAPEESQGAESENEEPKEA
jgi:large subunit ribosomal protein L10